MVEHCVYIAGVAGSSPALSTSYLTGQVAGVAGSSPALSTLLEINLILFLTR